MAVLLNLIFFLPPVLAAAMLRLPPERRNYTAVAGVGILTLFAVMLFFLPFEVRFAFPEALHLLFWAADIAVIGFFAYAGLRHRSMPVLLLALAQMALYLGVAGSAPAEKTADIVLNETARYMFLIINGVGGAIIIYALHYIQSEAVQQRRKNGFIALLFFFVGVMNMIVAANSIELFFLLFELTTLCSYLLIKFRQDAQSVENAKRALWMNQLGGLAILAAMAASLTAYETIYFDTLLSRANGAAWLLPLAFLALAAFVKAALIPFNSWLLGAMVAPTPVSAILHSATMVKIAPFLILKISGGFDATLSFLVALVGSFVFMTASLFALSKDYFKEVLGYSTIGLLGLMIALAAIADPLAHKAALFLICFHAVAKGALFLQAGILEKHYGVKYISQIRGLADRNPLFVAMIALAFGALTLPPFGVFLGKFMAIELFSQQMQSHPLFSVVLLFSVLGSVVLTLLYFRLLSNFYAKSAQSAGEGTAVDKRYFFPAAGLLAVLLAGAVLSFGTLGITQVLLPLLLLGTAGALVLLFRAKHIDRTKTYHCGEKEQAVLANSYFDFESRYMKRAQVLALVLMAAIVAGGWYV